MEPDFAGYTGSGVEILEIGATAKRDMLAIIDVRIVWQNIGGCTSAQPGGPFEQRYAATRLRENNRGRKAGQAAPDNDYVWRGHSPDFQRPAPARSMIQAFSKRDNPGCGCASTS